MTTKYIAYYRVSTAGQGASGLGLEAQRATVEAYAHGHIIASYTEVESGSKADRPQLTAALAACKQNDATLLIAKLDRLSRNVLFICTLMESKVRFKACDMPEADNFTVHIFAAVAQKEREMISQRTKAALKALKDKGVKLGNPNTNKAHMDSIRANRKPITDDINLLYIIENERNNNKTLSQIADNVNTLGHRTKRGHVFSATQIHRIIQRNSLIIIDGVTELPCNTQ